MDYDRKRQHHHQILHVQIQPGIKFSFKKEIEFVFLDQIFTKRVFTVYSRKSKHHHQIQYILYSSSTKFQLKKTILIFKINFAQKGYFWFKARKVNITTKFSSFELV